VRCVGGLSAVVTNYCTVVSHVGCGSYKNEVLNIIPSNIFTVREVSVESAEGNWKKTAEK
jgi:hypothetical protein